jgi:tripartite-type tricarboxylate transporter receptor subunit TctC
MRFRISALLLTLAVLLPGTARAQDYPTRPIKLVVAYSAGGVVDMVARLVASRLGPELKTKVVVENVVGASGLLGTNAVARAEPDGYTLTMANSSTMVLGPLLFKNAPYDPVKDFVPIAQVSAAPSILVVPTTLPVTSVRELAEFAKQKPGSLNYASFGRGGVAHLAAELFQITTGTKMTHVPYKGSGPALIDMMSGNAQLDVFFDSIPSALPFVQEGKLKALAVTGAKRSSALPNLPTVAETFPGFDISVWQGISAPAGTPAPVIAKLQEAIAAAMRDPVLQERFRTLGAEPLATSPDEFRDFVKNEVKRWSQALKDMGIQPE